MKRWNRSVFHRNVEKVLTRKIWGRPETGIPRQETGKRWRYQRILYWQEEVIDTSICSRQKEHGRIQGWNAHGTVQYRVEENMPVFYAWRV